MSTRELVRNETASGSRTVSIDRPSEPTPASGMSETEQAIEEVTELISLPEVYLKVRRLMDDPASDIYDFGKVISVDPNLSSRVLKAVNSAYFGFPKPVESIARAVNMIGMGLLHNMVLGISAISSIALPNEFIPLKTFWRASLFTGVLARLLAEQQRVDKSEQLFIAGLLHEIGHLVMYSRLPELSQTSRQRAYSEERPINEVARQIFGVPYAEEGARLMAKWNLPETLQTLTLNQPSPDANSELGMQAKILNLARDCAQQDAKEFPKTAAISFDEEVCEWTGLSQEELETTLDVARSMSADMEKVILA